MSADRVDRRLQSIDIWRTQLDLTVPYNLAFGSQHHFDSIFVRVTDETGSEGWGEATLLTGYTDETVEDSWTFLNNFASRAIGQSASEIKGRLVGGDRHTAFSRSALLSALAHMQTLPVLLANDSVELLGAINSKSFEPAILRAEADKLIGEGYRTLKVKVGFDLQADLRRVAIIQEIVGGHAALRIDANQGYSVEDGKTFVSTVDPENVELVEQPCKAGDWEAAQRTKEAARVPIMLDESIYGLEDIRRASDLQCADYIKLKLMKMDGIDGLIEGLELIKELKMKPVLGNGVASDIGCWQEACVAASHVDTAGEFNGFTRPKVSILKEPLDLKGARLQLHGRLPHVDLGALGSVSLAMNSYS